MSEHIPRDMALIIAALDDDDAERSAALAHARSCHACARVIQEGEAMLELLDAQIQEVPIHPRLKARIMETVAQAPQPSRWEPLALVFGMMLSACSAWFDGHARTGLHPVHGHSCVLWEVLGAALATVGANLWWRARQTGTPLPAVRIALLGMSGALAGQLWLRHECPTADAGLHLVVYHVTLVALFAFAGLIVHQQRWKRRT